MTSNYWIKLYHEILDDPKMGRLSADLWKLTIELFLVAGEVDNDGRLLPVIDLAWRLRRNEDELHAALIELEAVGIVHNDDGWIVTHFARRQAAVPDAERKRQQRKRDIREKYYSHETVTNRVTEKRREDTDKDKDTDVVVVDELRNIYKAYENDIGIITPIIAEKLKEMEKEYPSIWILDGINSAARQNKRSLAYVEGCCRNRKNGTSKPSGNGNGRRGDKYSHLTDAEKRAKYAEYDNTDQKAEGRV